MQKEIQLTDKTLLVVGLKRNCTRVRHLETINELEIVYGDVIFGKEYKYIKLVGDWQLVGIYPELTEDIAHSLVEHTFDGNLKKYFNYKNGYYSHSLFTALESFQSLMEREKCYTVNPYHKPTEDLSFYDQPSDYDICLAKYQKAQQTTFDKYAILIKSK